jgi:hypothetical protein
MVGRYSATVVIADATYFDPLAALNCRDRWPSSSTVDPVKPDS